VSAVLFRLLNTPLCWLHRFIANSKSRYYNPSLHWVLTPWCLVSGRSFDVFSFRRLAANWLDYSRSYLVTNLDYSRLIWLSATDSGCRNPLLKADIPGPDMEHLLSWLYIPSQQLRCLGNTTANSIRCRGSIRSACTFRNNGFIFPCFVYSKGTSLRRNAEIRTRPLHNIVNLSQYIEKVELVSHTWKRREVFLYRGVLFQFWNKNLIPYKYYVFGHYPLSCLYLKIVLFIFKKITFQRLDSVSVFR
jgi:hypothetical protein